MLQDVGWSEVLTEYNEANSHIDDGDHGVAVNAAGRALESALADFLKARGIAVAENSTMQDLIAAIPRSFVESDADLPFKAVRHVMNAVAKRRNPASHRKAIRPASSPAGPFGAVFVRNIVAAAVIFLCQHERQRRADATA